MSGPMPQRSEDLAEPRKASRGEVTKGVARKVRVPHPDQSWHPIALKLYEGLKTSGQADYYQNSDWAFAYSLCEDLSEYKKAGRRSGQQLQTIYSAMERLLVTEGDRRRARLELEAEQPDIEPASVTAINDYKQGLGLVKGAG